MEVVNLPQDLNLQTTPAFNVFDYQTSQECNKQMVSLQKNTFSFLMEGNKEVYADKTSISIENSNFILMKSGHCLMTERLSNAMHNYRSILFFFSDESLLKFIQKHNLSNPNKEKKDSIYSSKYDPFLKNFVNGLIHISTLTPALQTKLLAVKFEELMLYLTEIKGVTFIFSLITNIDNQHQHFLETVAFNQLNKLTLKELSFLSNMSISTFKREFQKEFQSSPSKWFQEKRLDHAAFLLNDKSNRPSDIYEEIGYESLSNFIQAFKSKFGITPKQQQSS